MKKIYFIMVLAGLAIAAVSCVKDKIYSIPVFTGIENTEAYSEADEVTVTAKVQALVNVVSVKLYYNSGEQYTEVEMSGTFENGAGEYKGKIPGKPKDTEVSYYAEALSEKGDIAKSNIIKYKVGEVPVDYTGLILNELNGNDKFIELYNKGSKEIYIGGILMFKDSNMEAGNHIWKAPSKKMAAGEYLVLKSNKADGVDPNDPYVFNSGLSNKKSVRITITKPDGTSIIDDFNLDNPTNKVYSGSFGRNQDGKWYHQETKTPGAANVDGTEALTMK